MTAALVTLNAADVLLKGVANPRVTLSCIDVLLKGAANLRVTVSCIDVLVSNADYVRPNNESIFGKIDGTDKTFTYSKTGTLGDGNFAARKLFIGSRGGSSNFFNGELSELVVRATESSDAELTKASKAVK